MRSNFGSIVITLVIVTSALLFAVAPAGKNDRHLRLGAGIVFGF